jgi:hypothetical protein
MLSRIKRGNLLLLSGLVMLAAAGANFFWHDSSSANPPPGGAVYDGYRRLVGYAGKTERPCPPPTARTAIILAIGQSNIANEAAVRVDTRHPNAVLSYFDGKCYATRANS